MEKYDLLFLLRNNKRLSDENKKYIELMNQFIDNIEYYQDEIAGSWFTIRQEALDLINGGE